MLRSVERSKEMVKRNVINHEEINGFLLELKGKQDNFLFNQFVDVQVRNFLYREAPLRVVHGFKASFPGPYHGVVLSKSFKEKIKSLCHKILFQILEGEIDSNLKLSSVVIGDIIKPERNLIANEGDYSFYEIQTKEELNRVGFNLHNCLKESRIDGAVKYFLVKDKDQRDYAVIAANSGNVIQAKKDFNANLSPEERKMFFEILNLKKIRSASSEIIVVLGLIVIGLNLWHLDNLPGGVLRLFPVVFLIAFLFTEGVAPFLFNSKVQKVIKKIKLERFFYEKI